MVKQIKAKIKYRIKKTHPDYDCAPVNERDGYMEFEDIYKMDTDRFWSDDYMMDYIKNDLRLVAGGGYDWDHIYDVSFEFN